MICGNFSANSSNEIPNAFLVAITSLPKSGTDNDLSIFSRLVLLILNSLSLSSTLFSRDLKFL